MTTVEAGTVKSARRRLNRRLAERTSAGDRLAKEERAEAAAAGQIAAAEEALKVAQAVAAEVQNLAHRRIASVVTRALRTVFGETAYEFRIVFEAKRNKTEARLVFINGDGLEMEPLTSCGGGVADVASFALRLSCLVLARPPRRRFLVLDEPFRFVSRDLRPRVRELIEVLAEELEVQFLIVTHMPDLICGEVVEL